MSSIEPLPGALTSMWRALKRGYVAEPTLLSISFALALLAALPDALYAVWLGLLGYGLIESNSFYVWLGALGMGASATLTWGLRVISDRTQRRFRDRVAIALESHVANLQASIVGVELHERAAYLDRMAVLRDQVFTLDHMYMSIFSTAGWFLRLGVTVSILAVIHPVLLTLVLFAIPSLASSWWRPAIERAIEERYASSDRLARHLFDIATTAPPGKEVRVTGFTHDLVKRRREAWNSWYKPVSRARNGSGVYQSLAWSIFGIGFVLAVVFVVFGVQAPAAETLLLIGAGSRLAGYISATAGELGFLRGIWMDGSKRLAWLEDYAEQQLANASGKVPSRLENGIEFNNVSFKYPDAERYALKNISLKLNAGSVVAIVGENGAGKTTLVKLLAQMYKPTEGQILIDNHDLAFFPAADWRSRLAGAFQDFFRFELQAKATVGIGDEPHMSNGNAVAQAVERAGADDVIDQLKNGLDTQLGPAWPEGVEVSFGQWQKLSLARGFMREAPLLLLLDEPTAALDAETEYALYERYAQGIADSASSNGAPGSGQITLLVSHRFSTVRMADQIIVLDGASLVEAGSHEELMAANGQYAKLYETQAAAYR
ncbi:MAG: ABC transporter ATP-binding protein [Gammaproteobacteria bacterium]|nr:ABC transporter ATP-binding protein [Gammaproteobacteria bacterium]